MLKKALFPLAVATGVVLAPSAALANTCFNASRGTQNATPWETERGPWFLLQPEGPGTEGLDPIWVFGTPENFQNGKGESLLDLAACPTARLLGQTQGELEFNALNGVWGESCVTNALEGIGG